MSFIITFIIAFFSSLLLTPLLKAISFKFNILDNPGHRKIHSSPIPLMGGFAIYLSFVIALILTKTISREIFGILFVGLIFVLFGLLDDAGIKMRARYKIW